MLDVPALRPGFVATRLFGGSYAPVLLFQSGNVGSQRFRAGSASHRYGDYVRLLPARAGRGRSSVCLANRSSRSKDPCRSSATWFLPISVPKLPRWRVWVPYLGAPVPRSYPIARACPFGRGAHGSAVVFDEIGA